MRWNDIIKRRRSEFSSGKISAIISYKRNFLKNFLIELKYIKIDIKNKFRGTSLILEISSQIKPY